MNYNFFKSEELDKITGKNVLTEKEYNRKIQFVLDNESYLDKYYRENMENKKPDSTTVIPDTDNKEHNPNIDNGKKLGIKTQTGGKYFIDFETLEMYDLDDQCLVLKYQGGIIDEIHIVNNRFYYEEIFKMIERRKKYQRVDKLGFKYPDDTITEY